MIAIRKLLSWLALSTAAVAFLHIPGCHKELIEAPSEPPNEPPNLAGVDLQIAGLSYCIAAGNGGLQPGASLDVTVTIYDNAAAGTIIDTERYEFDETHPQNGVFTFPISVPTNYAFEVSFVAESKLCGSCPDCGQQCNYESARVRNEGSQRFNNRITAGQALVVPARPLHCECTRAECTSTGGGREDGNGGQPGGGGSTGMGGAPSTFGGTESEGEGGGASGTQAGCAGVGGATAGTDEEESGGSAGEAGAGGASNGPRLYICGHALPGYRCDNGRNHAFVSAMDLREAVAACPGVRPAPYTDFCYVIAADGATETDDSECSSLSGSWRPGRDCCNFFGTLSCPE